MKIVCYGDSNTYGWDPRFFSGDRYDHPWPELLAGMTGHDAVNCGEPGRVIPVRAESLEQFGQEVRLHKPDLLVIMLGTNDVLGRFDPYADDVIRNMDNMICYTIRNGLAGKVLLLSCPQASIEYGRYNESLQNVSAGYRKITEREGIGFADPYRWEIPLSFDGVHFSEEGHTLFAERMKEVVERL